MLSVLAYGQSNYSVRSIEFIGNHIITANQLLSSISIKNGGMFSRNRLTADIERVLELYKQQAYLHAVIDSAVVKNDTTSLFVDVQIFISEGKQSIIRAIQLEGMKSATENEIRKNIQLKEDEPFFPSILEQDILNILRFYESNGFPLAKTAIQNISFTDSANEKSVTIKIKIDEGKKLHIAEIQIEGNKTTRDYVLLREARLKEDEIFRSDIPERIKRRLDHLQLFSSVSLPELYLTEKEQAGLLVKVVEGNHNSFDGVLGYVPAQNTGASGYVTGLVNLSFRNLFGSGRKLSARWYQENKDSRETELHYLEPWVASYPINMQFGFFQRKQDSVFVKMQYDFSAEFMVVEEFSVGASFSQTVVYPTEGYGRLVMAESKTTSYGLSVCYDSRDNPTTPTSGILYSTEYKTGTKTTISSGLAPEKSESATRKLILDVSYYLSPSYFLRQVIASELHLRDFSSGNLDMSDLFQLGGAVTLRGYREGQFLGSRLLWSNFEYRFIIAQRSYFYGFVDAGYIVRPNITAIGMTAAEQSKVGYGIGVRMDSSLGLIGVSFAMGEGDTFTTSKIHVRLINEF